MACPLATEVRREVLHLDHVRPSLAPGLVLDLKGGGLSPRLDDFTRVQDGCNADSVHDEHVSHLNRARWLGKADAVARIGERFAFVHRSIGHALRFEPVLDLTRRGYALR